jgi:hypothetical protein
MTLLYRRPTGSVALSAAPQLANWDRAGSPGQVRLGSSLFDIEVVAGPLIAAINGRLSVELTVGLPGSMPLTSGGRDLDNYMYPIAQRLGGGRIAAMFGRKAHGSSCLAIGSAEPDVAMAPLFSARITGSYERRNWKESLHDRLVQAHVIQADPGPVAMEIALTTGPDRNWVNIWKPLIDSFGPVLGEDPARPFHPHDDRIISLGMHHRVDTAVGHDLIVEACWATC